VPQSKRFARNDRAYNLSMNPQDLRRWVENQRAGEARVREDARQNPLTSAEAWAAAMALLNLDEQLNGPPFNRYDPVSEREDAAMWENWAKLRARWPR
jgi:hypothetical protein